MMCVRMLCSSGLRLEFRPAQASWSTPSWHRLHYRDPRAEIECPHNTEIHPGINEAIHICTQLVRFLAGILNQVGSDVTTLLLISRPSCHFFSYRIGQFHRSPVIGSSDAPTWKIKNFLPRHASYIRNQKTIECVPHRMQHFTTKKIGWTR